ncbi:hypothetical protein ONZ45_g12760 [Pleurotus djamor]|nr:hypothetical protein ONZ45_g12760 [Pleurotus djamor]
MTRVWLITGASSGFGKLTAEAVLANGEIVVATARTPSSLDYLKAKYPVTQFIVVKCDVVIKQDVIFNNCAIGVMAEVENEEQDEDTRNVFEVNFWGAGNVMREAVNVKSFRDRNPAGAGGLLLNNSSVNGHYGGPGMGYYVASKHALEGLTESLANELNPKWNIKISLIQLSIFKTEMHEAKVLRVFPPPAAYADPKPAQQFRKDIDYVKNKLGGWGLDAECLAEFQQVVAEHGHKTNLYIPFKGMVNAFYATMVSDRISVNAHLRTLGAASRQPDGLFLLKSLPTDADATWAASKAYLEMYSKKRPRRMRVAEPGSSPAPSSMQTLVGLRVH